VKLSIPTVSRRSQRDSWRHPSFNAPFNTAIHDHPFRRRNLGIGSKSPMLIVTVRRVVDKMGSQEIRAKSDDLITAWPRAQKKLKQDESAARRSPSATSARSACASSAPIITPPESDHPRGRGSRKTPRVPPPSPRPHSSHQIVARPSCRSPCYPHNDHRARRWRGSRPDKISSATIKGLLKSRRLMDGRHRVRCSISRNRIWGPP